MLSLRGAEVADTGSIHTVHTSAILGLCSASYSEESVKQWAARQTPSQYIPFIEAREITLALSPQGEVMGFGHLTQGDKSDSSGTCEVKGLFVSPLWARKGVGSSLLLFMEQQAKDGGCKVIQVKSSLNAVAFYEKVGYTVTDPSGVHVCCNQTLQCVSMVKNLNNA